ncbi:hypothetical protein HK404_36545, partial [Myxococcus xanthus]|nr:hypothetical protein [Myxococcus xanthus]
MEADEAQLAHQVLHGEGEVDEAAQVFGGASWLASFLETEQLNDPETNGIVVPRIVNTGLRLDDTLKSGP